MRTFTLIILLALASSVSMAGYQAVVAETDRPAAPVLEATQDVTGITLKWNVPAYDGDLVKYFILASVGNSEEFSTIQTFSANVRNIALLCNSDLDCDALQPSTGSGDTVTAKLTHLGVGTNYTFKVYAEGTIAGEQSNTVTVTTFDLPGRPTNLKGEPGPSSIKLMWDPPDSDGGTPITHYVIFGSIGTVNPLTEIITIPAPSNNSHTLENLTPGLPYLIGIHATNALGSSSPSNGIIVTPSS